MPIRNTRKRPFSSSTTSFTTHQARQKAHVLLWPAVVSKLELRSCRRKSVVKVYDSDRNDMIKEQIFPYNSRECVSDVPCYVL